MKHLKDSFLRGLLKAGNSLFLELKWHYDAKDIRVNRIKLTGLLKHYKKNLEQNPKINKVNNVGTSRIKFKLMD